MGDDYSMSLTYPPSTARHLVERVEAVPEGAHARHWVLRDDNAQHFHGVVSLAESPLYMALGWKLDGRSREQHVGLYRLHLGELLAEDYVRYEREETPGDEVRLRFHRGDRGVVFIQSRADRPKLPIGTVDLAG